MDTAFQILVIILSILSAVLMILAIVVLALLLKLLKQAKVVVDKGEQTLNEVGQAVQSIKLNIGTAGVVRMLTNVIKAVSKLK